MTLFLRRDSSAGNVGFVIFDELGNEKYRAVFKRTKVSTNYSISVTDTSGNIAAKIRRLPIVGTNTYVLRVNRRHVTFVAVPTAKGVYSYFYGNNWHINGEIASKNFTIIDVDKSVILEHTKHRDYCELNITDSSNELYCVAASICVNLINTVDMLAVQAV